MSSFALEVERVPDEEWINVLQRTPWSYWPFNVRRHWFTERQASKRELLEFAKYINELESA